MTLIERRENIKQTKKCPICGQLNDIKAKECIKCQTRLKNSTISTNKETDETKTYDIYFRFSEGSDKLRAVKNGFSWPAFFFSALWAWFNGMIGVGFGLLFIGVIHNVITKIMIIFLPPGLSLILNLFLTLSIHCWIGSYGNKWLRSSLEKKGYSLKLANVPGSSPSEAIRLYKEQGHAK